MINFEDFKVFKIEPTVKTNRRPTDGQQKTDNVRKKTIQQKIDRRQAEDSVAMKIENGPKMKTRNLWFQKKYVL